MLSQDTLKRHAALVDRMADAQGVDLQEAALRGQLTVSQIEDAVLTCAGCAKTGACERWLDAQRGQADAPPSFCRNTALFAELSRG